MARSSFRRLLLVGGALTAVAAGAYVKREHVRELLPGRSSGPEPYSPPAPPAPSNCGAPGPPADAATPVPAPSPSSPPTQRARDPVEEQAMPADNPQAVEAAVDRAAAEAMEDGNRDRRRPRPAGRDRSRSTRRPRSRQRLPRPPRWAASRTVAGSRPASPSGGAVRPSQSPARAESEGFEQAEAELEENASVGDGMSNAKREIDDTIEAAATPPVGERPRRPMSTGDPEGDEDDDVCSGESQTWSEAPSRPSERQRPEGRQPKAEETQAQLKGCAPPIR